MGLRSRKGRMTETREAESPQGLTQYLMTSRSERLTDPKDFGPEEAPSNAKAYRPSLNGGAFCFARTGLHSQRPRRATSRIDSETHAQRGDQLLWRRHAPQPLHAGRNPRPIDIAEQP